MLLRMEIANLLQALSYGEALQFRGYTIHRVLYGYQIKHEVMTLEQVLNTIF